MMRQADMHRHDPVLHPWEQDAPLTKLHHDWLRETAECPKAAVRAPWSEWRRLEKYENGS